MFKEWSDKSIHFALAGGSIKWQVVSTLRSMTEDTYLTPTLHTLNRTEPEKHSSQDHLNLCQMQELKTFHEAGSIDTIDLQFPST